MNLTCMPGCLAVVIDKPFRHNRLFYGTHRFYSTMPSSSHSHLSTYVYKRKIRTLCCRKTITLFFIWFWRGILLICILLHNGIIIPRIIQVFLFWVLRKSMVWHNDFLIISVKLLHTYLCCSYNWFPHIYKISFFHGKIACLSHPHLLAEQILIFNSMRKTSFTQKLSTLTVTEIINFYDSILLFSCYFQQIDHQNTSAKVRSPESFSNFWQSANTKQSVLVMAKMWWLFIYLFSILTFSKALSIFITVSFEVCGNFAIRSRFDAVA